MWKNEITKVYIVPVVTGALGMSRYKQISRNNWLQCIRKKLQKARLLGTVGILRKILDYND